MAREVAANNVGLGADQNAPPWWVKLQEQMDADVASGKLPAERLYDPERIAEVAAAVSDPDLPAYHYKRDVLPMFPDLPVPEFEDVSRLEPTELDSVPLAERVANAADIAGDDAELQRLIDEWDEQNPVGPTQ